MKQAFKLKDVIDYLSLFSFFAGESFFIKVHDNMEKFSVPHIIFNKEPEIKFTYWDSGTVEYGSEITTR